jgi:hypothetical protein
MKLLWWFALLSLVFMFGSVALVLQLHMASPEHPRWMNPSVPLRFTSPHEAVNTAAPTTIASILQSTEQANIVDGPVMSHLLDSASQVQRSNDVAITASMRVANDMSLSLSSALSAINERVRVFGDNGRFNLAPDRVIIVVMTYARPGYVERLLKSLSAVEGGCFKILHLFVMNLTMQCGAGIDETTLIVSTDGYNRDIAHVVDRVRFMHTKQVFFPASPHLFLHMHPGTDPRDCGRDFPPQEQKKSGDV